MRRVLMVSQHPYASHQTEAPFWSHPVVSRNVRELLAHGVDVDLVCTTPHLCLGQEPPDRPGLRVYGIPMRERRSPALWYPIQYSLFFLWALGVVSVLGLRRRYDVVQVDNLPDFLVFSAVVPRLRRMPVVFVLLELMPDMMAARLRLNAGDLRVRLVTWLELKATRYADRVITVSDRLRRIMASRGLDPARVTIVPNSHPLGDIPARRPASTPVLILPTTLIERYGAQVAIWAVAELRHEWPEVVLEILGDGEYRSTLVALTEQLGLQKHVTFTPGFIPWRQAVERVRGATLGIVPIIADGYGDLMLPNKVCEFVFMDVPFACSRLAGIEEHLPADAVAYFEPGDSSGLAAQISRLLRNPEQARQQAKRARLAMAELAWENASSRYLEALGMAPDLTQKKTDEVRCPRIGAAADGAEPSLYSSNTPAAFWRLLSEPAPTSDDWAAAARAAIGQLPEAVRAGGDDIDALLFSTLGEGQFGTDHWRLSSSLQLYYTLRPFLPRWFTLMLRRSRSLTVRNRALLGWPVEDGYVRFLRMTVAGLLRQSGLAAVPFIHFWPHGRRCALVLTHDVETAIGQARVRELADIDASHGFRSSFNFVPERYALDLDLVDELRQNGFEVGVHGLKHDGRLFQSHREFLRQAERINRHVKALGATGFRAPCTHRHPGWMQVLDIEYDLSFFDSDPYEPIPGGTMSLWPFEIGRFMELPYTLVQDYTLTSVLKETSPRLWVEKVDFIRRHCGMALVNTHPDYLSDRVTRQVYTAFLAAMSSRGDYWNARPQEVARWWRARREARSIGDLPGAVQGTISLADEGAAPHLGLSVDGLALAG